MKLEEFNYNLPKELIAQEPAEPRDFCWTRTPAPGSTIISGIFWMKSVRAMYSYSTIPR